MKIRSMQPTNRERSSVGVHNPLVQFSNVFNLISAWLSCEDVLSSIFCRQLLHKTFWSCFTIKQLTYETTFFMCATCWCVHEVMMFAVWLYIGCWVLIGSSWGQGGVEDWDNLNKCLQVIKAVLIFTFLKKSVHHCLLHNVVYLLRN